MSRGPGHLLPPLLARAMNPGSSDGGLHCKGQEAEEDAEGPAVSEGLLSLFWKLWAQGPLAFGGKNWRKRMKDNTEMAVGQHPNRNCSEHPNPH